MKIELASLEIRQFVEGDTKALHLIRNHESVRRYMADPSSVPYESHEEWVRNNLIDKKNLLLFMVRRKGEAIGFTLLKKVSEDTAEMGVIFKEANKYPGVIYSATVITLYIAFCCLKLSVLVSYVIPGHDRAISLNRSFGGWEIESDKPGMIRFCVSREVCLGNKNYQKGFSRIKSKLKIMGDDASPFSVWTIML